MRSLTTRLATFACGAMIVALLADGCASLHGRAGSEALLLPPASLREDASRSQRLSISRIGGAAGDATLTLDAVVEVDATALRVAAFLLGQRVLLLAWDGEHLQEVRENVVPATLSGAGVLRDLQLVYWPEGAIREHLPRGWRLTVDAGRRRLYERDRLVFESERADAADPLGSATLANHAAGYRIVIESARAGGP